jgi:hypothetical protein
MLKQQKGKGQIQLAESLFNIDISAEKEDYLIKQVAFTI